MEICGAGTSDLFARISAARKQRIENTADDAGTEVDRYLIDSCIELSSLNSYPNTAQHQELVHFMISLNTGLPAIAQPWSACFL